ncbi:MAG: 2-amino-4-hydroxy-6-hydroxymethyldihydropteridine diphosphokinase [Bacteroidota bacterium]
MSPNYHTTRVYLSLGANLGEIENTLRRARILINLCIGPILKASSEYSTSPWGDENQETFVNQVLVINCPQEPMQLLSKCQSIERRLGKKTVRYWGPRAIDIDILFFGKETINRPELVVPHPYLQDRKFVLIPLAQVNGDMIHPVFQETIEALLAKCSDTGSVEELP